MSTPSNRSLFVNSGLWREVGRELIRLLRSMARFAVFCMVGWIVIIFIYDLRFPLPQSVGVAVIVSLLVIPFTLTVLDELSRIAMCHRAGQG